MPALYELCNERCANCGARTDGERIVFGMPACSPGCERVILDEALVEQSLARELAYEPSEDFSPNGSWFEESCP